MSIHTLAKHVQDSGRGKDSMLVHMSPNEVHGLQALAKAHGGSLTVNPKTGLPEAGFLEQILPVVAAAAATYFTAGAAAPALAAATGMGATSAGILAGAGSGALISGATAAAQGKDAGKAALMGGLGGAVAGGLGAYGDAASMAEQAGTSGIPTSPLQEGSKEAIASGYGTATNTPMTQQQFSDLNSFTGTPQAPGTVPAGVPSPTIPNTPTGSELSNLQAGGPQAPNVSPSPPGTTSSYYRNLPADSYFQKAAIQSLPALGLVDDENKGAQVTPEEPSRLKRISPNFRAQMPIQPNPYYNAQYPTYAAEGGLMSLAQGGSPVEQLSQNMMGGQGNMYPLSQQEHTNFATPTQMPASAEVIRSDYDAKTNPYTGVMMRSGGIADLGTYSDGGRMLKGRGDGMSDSIPGIIGNKQPARLADGEFVVPADVVSHLGNGSTDAGAKRLYSMMDKVRQARTGKKAQAPAVNPAKMMPA